MQFATTHGLTFNEKRDLYTACGYDRVLTPDKYRERYRRNGVARRLVNALPSATWRAGADMVENDDPNVLTPFEEGWLELQERVAVWDQMRTADILAQLGQYSAILIGAGGDLQQELPRVSSAAVRRTDALAFLRPYSQRDVTIKDEDLVGYPFTSQTSSDPRFGKPKVYTFKRLAGTMTREVKVHWTRVIHVADETLEDELFGEPRLATVWNWLDDLEKVAGSGSEAYWRRVQPMLTASPKEGASPIDPGDEKKIEEEIDKLIHGMRRWARLSGIELETVGDTQVSSFATPIDALIGLIVTAYGLPQRILQGSERGEQASSQDRSNWDQQVKDRRSQFADARCLRPFLNRLIEFGYLVEPESYKVNWPSTRDMDTAEKLDLAKKAADMNRAQGEMIMPTNEIRGNLLDLDPLDPDEIMVSTPARTRDQLVQAKRSLRAMRRRMTKARPRPRPRPALVTGASM